MRTKITERNAANVMGKVNTFFKKDVKEDLGMKMVEVGREPVFDERGKLFWEKPIWEEQRVFVSYTGRCDVHWLRKEYLKKVKNGERIFTHDKTDCLLAISTPYDTDCLPISIGDTVELKGNQLIVKRCIMNGCYSIRRFVQTVVNSEERTAELKHGLYSHLTWFCDNSLWWDIAMEEFHGMACEINCIDSEIHHAFGNLIEEIDLSQATGTFRKTISMKDIAEDHYVDNDDFEFDIIVDVDAIKTDANKIFSIILDGKEVDSYGVISKAFVRNDDIEDDCDEAYNC